MKRQLLLTAALAAVIGISAVGIAQAGGNGGGAGGGGSASGGAQSQSQAQNQSQERYRAEHGYRYEYQNGDQLGVGYGDQLRSRDRDRTRLEWKTMSQVSDGLAGAGYKVRAMQTERSRYTARVMDGAGNRLHLRTGPISGAILGQAPE